MTDLAELLKRVEEAEGPDRAIDLAIGLALDGWFIKPLQINIPDETWNMVHMPMPGGGYYIVTDSPGAEYTAFTASLDAAVALVEKQLHNLSAWSLYTPGRRVVERIGDSGMAKSVIAGKFGCTIHSPISSGGGPKWDGYGPTPALALIAALLRVKLAATPPSSGGQAK
jgi:hypothetical protein